LICSNEYAGHKNAPFPGPPVINNLPGHEKGINQGRGVAANLSGHENATNPGRGVTNKPLVGREYYYGAGKDLIKKINSHYDRLLK